MPAVTESPELQQRLEAIEARHPDRIELGLDRVRAVAERMGLLPVPLPVVLVGGTNGKGSTLAFLEAALAEGPHRVGAYTSPHLFRFNERVRVDGAPMDDGALVKALEAVESVREGVPLTYFEHTTLAAMRVLCRRVDIALMEVGLGGRLDAVNIWDPAVSVITSVDLDHQAYLGSDREAIGFEKAGILRPSVPAVCGDRDPPESVRRCEGPELRILDRDFRAVATGPDVWRWRGEAHELGPLPTPRLAGRYQVRNAATAVAAGEVLPECFRPGLAAWQNGLRRALILGRGQVVDGDVPVWLDVAHNPGAAREFAALLAESPVPGRSLAVFGAMRDKEVAEIAQAMTGVIDRWYPCTIPGPRGLSGAELAERLGVPCDRRAAIFEDPVAALSAARAEAQPGKDRVVAFGGFPVVASVLEALDARTG